MIEVDLSPGNSGRRTEHPRRVRSAGRLPAIKLDMWVLMCGVVAAGSLGTATYLVVAASRQLSELEVAVGNALSDSTHTAATSEVMRRLHARSDSMIARISTIEDLDASRFQWPHILDEVAAALPAGAWITGIADVASEESVISFQVQGGASDNFALTRFWNALEASFFIRDVELITTEHLGGHVAGGVGDPSAWYRFVLGARYESPPDEIVEMVHYEPDAP